MGFLRSNKGFWGRGAVVLAWGLGAACATAPVPPAVRLPVPLVLQNDDYSCGTTAVAMVVSFLRPGDPPLDPDLAWDLSGSDPEFARTQGFDIPGLQRLAARYGFRAALVDRLGLGGLKRLLTQGVPVVLFIEPEVGQPFTHAVVAMGYVEATGTLLVADPAGRRRFFGDQELLDRWQAHLGRPRLDSVRAALVVSPASP